MRKRWRRLSEDEIVFTIFEYSWIYERQLFYHSSLLLKQIDIGVDFFSQILAKPTGGQECKDESIC